MDTLSPEERSERMSLVRNKDTKPEMIVRHLLTALGYRYRLHSKNLPGRPDIVFPGRRKALQVHGCFWHRHPDPSCSLARLPKSRLDFWVPKLAANRERDLRNEALLREEGWSLLVLWECDVARNPDALTQRLVQFLGPVRAAAAKPT